MKHLNKEPTTKMVGVSSFAAGRSRLPSLSQPRLSFVVGLFQNLLQLTDSAVKGKAEQVGGCGVSHTLQAEMCSLCRELFEVHGLACRPFKCMACVWQMLQTLR